MKAYIGLFASWLIILTVCLAVIVFIVYLGASFVMWDWLESPLAEWGPPQWRALALLVVGGSLLVAAFKD